MSPSTYFNEVEYSFESPSKSSALLSKIKFREYSLASF
jgi:hypothetical protein